MEEAGKKRGLLFLPTSMDGRGWNFITDSFLSPMAHCHCCFTGVPGNLGRTGLVQGRAAPESMAPCHGERGGGSGNGVTAVQILFLIFHCHRSLFPQITFFPLALLRSSNCRVAGSKLWICMSDPVTVLSILSHCLFPANLHRQKLTPVWRPVS